MSRFAAYLEEMPLPALSNNDIEMILSGTTLAGSETRHLEAFVPALATIAETRERSVNLMGVTLADIARKSRPEPVSASPIWGRAAVLMAALGLVATLGGVAAAADGAMPGDPLYAIDRALERVGFGDGGVDERIAEFDSLVGRGQVESAYAMLEDVIVSADREDSARAARHLETAAAASSPSDNASQDSVADVGKSSEMAQPPLPDGGRGSTQPSPVNATGDAGDTPRGSQPDHAHTPGQDSSGVGSGNQGNQTGTETGGPGNRGSGAPSQEGEAPHGNGSNGDNGQGNDSDGDQGQGNQDSSSSQGNDGQGSSSQGNDGQGSSSQGNGGQGSSSQGNDGQGNGGNERT